MGRYDLIRTGQGLKAITADTFNNAVGAAKFVDDFRNGVTSARGLGSDHSSTVVKVFNATGVLIPAGGVVRVVCGFPTFAPTAVNLDAVPSPAGNELEFLADPIYRVRKPFKWLPSFNKHVYGFTRGPINPGEIGTAVIDGLVIGRVKVTTPFTEYAKPESNNVTNLVSAADGPFRIMGTSPGQSPGVLGEGELWAVLRRVDRGVARAVYAKIASGQAPDNLDGSRGEWLYDIYDPLFPDNPAALIATGVEVFGRPITIASLSVDGASYFPGEGMVWAMYIESSLSGTYPGDSTEDPALIGVSSGKWYIVGNGRDSLAVGDCEGEAPGGGA